MGKAVVDNRHVPDKRIRRGQEKVAWDRVYFLIMVYRYRVVVFCTC
jgi:hypothetical protein